MARKTAEFPYGVPDYRYHLDIEQLAMPMVLYGGVSRQREPIVLTEHAHRGYELHVILSGRSTQITALGECLEGVGGSVLVMQPGMLHRGVDDIIPKSELCWLVIDPSCAGAERYTSFDHASCRVFDHRLAAVGNRAVTASAHTLSITARLKMLLEHAVVDVVAQRSCLNELMINCLSDLEQSSGSVSSQAEEEALLPDSVQLAIRILTSECQENIAIPTLAAQVGVSTSRLYQLFKQYMGMTPADYHLRHRISVARDLLRAQPQQSIADIAHRTGFSSARHFSTRFKTFVGVSPSAWRHDCLEAVS
jgi:AraC-like DNA-binding protein